MNKICSKCKVEKDLEDFSPLKRSKDGKHSQCRACISLKMKEIYQRDPAKKNKANALLQGKIAAAVNAVKLERGCAVCPEREPVCLDFHHRDSAGKMDEVSFWVRAKSLQKAMEEISRCVCVCSNCHRKIHAKLIKNLDSSESSVKLKT